MANESMTVLSGFLGPFLEARSIMGQRFVDRENRQDNSCTNGESGLDLGIELFSLNPLLLIKREHSNVVLSTRGSIVFPLSMEGASHP